jgi:hypothetical protein
MFQHDLNHSGSAASSNSANSFKPLWNFTTDASVSSSPVVANGRVFAGSWNGHFYCLNASTGQQIWCEPTGNQMHMAAAIDNNRIYVAADDEWLYCFNITDGNYVWISKVGGYIQSSPAIADGKVYIGSGRQNLYCFKASTGEKVWQSPTGFWTTSSPAVAGGNVYVGSEDYNLYCVNASTGAKQWSYQTGGYVDSSPAIADNTLYVGSLDHQIYAFALCSSTTEAPLTLTSTLPWSTIAFDAVVCAIGAAIVFGILFFAISKRRVKPEVLPKKAPWFSVHKDALCIMAILAFSAVFFVNLARGQLWAADEQTYSQWAYHMFRIGDYLTPSAFGDSAVWAGKPPLIMRLMAFSYQFLGVNNISTRIWAQSLAP